MFSEVLRPTPSALVYRVVYAVALAMLWWGAGWKVALGAFLFLWAHNMEEATTS